MNNLIVPTVEVTEQKKSDPSRKQTLHSTQNIKILTYDILNWDHFQIQCIGIAIYITLLSQAETYVPAGRLRVSHRAVKLKQTWCPILGM